MTDKKYNLTLPGQLVNEQMGLGIARRLSVVHRRLQGVQCG